MSNNQSELINLIAERQQLIDADVVWDDDGRSAQRALDRIQSQILAVDFRGSEAFVVAAKLLVSSDDEPNFADGFRNELFDALRNAA